MRAGVKLTWKEEAYMGYYDKTPIVSASLLITCVAILLKYRMATSFWNHADLGLILVNVVDVWRSYLVHSSFLLPIHKIGITLCTWKSYYKDHTRDVLSTVCGVNTLLESGES